MKKIEFQAGPVSCSVNPLSFDDALCIGCNRCASVCQVDIMVPSPEQGKHPVVLYPGECYYCGSCVMACPVKGAIHLRHPLMNQTRFGGIESGWPQQVRHNKIKAGSGMI